MVSSKQDSVVGIIHKGATHTKHMSISIERVLVLSMRGTGVHVMYSKLIWERKYLSDQYYVNVYTASPMLTISLMHTEFIRFRAELLDKNITIFKQGRIEPNSIMRLDNSGTVRSPGKVYGQMTCKLWITWAARVFDF